MSDSAAEGDVPAVITDNEQVVANIERMRGDVASSPEIYRPGAFWDDLLELNIEMLRSEGVENLKRTVSNNYYNWIVTSLRDPQMQRAVINWLRRPRVAPLRTRMEPATGLRTMVRDGVFALSPGAAMRYRFFVGSAWECARNDDPLGLTSRLAEPEVGNPVRLWRGEQLISQDLANSIIECSFASRAGTVRDGARVAELGAGYGRLAHVFAEAAKLTYCIFDIPPALAVSQWYLTHVLGKERIVCYQRWSSWELLERALKPGAVAFFTPDQLELFPDGWFDLTQTVSTLPEMPEPQSTHFLKLLAAKSSNALFLKQWRGWRNEADDVELTEASYRLDQPWRLAHRRVDPVQPAFFNQLWLR